MSPRAAITAIFTLDGFALGTWGGRVPAIQDHIGGGPGALALPLAAVAAGALLAMPVSGRAAGRFGSARVVAVTVLVLGLALPLPALLPGLALVTLGAFVIGAANGSLDVAMNAQGVSVERARRRPILSSLHAGFSVGALSGAAIGALAAGAGIGALAHFSVVGALVAVAGTLCIGALLADRPDPAPDARAPGRGQRRRLRALAFCCLLSEGAALDWSAVHLRGAGAAAATAALAYAGFSLAMTAGRLAGDRLSLRWGPVLLARRGAALGATALALALVADAPVPGLLAYTALGAGLSVVVPMVFRAAATGGEAGRGLAGVTSVGYLGFLAGPPLIGGLAAATSLPTALWVVVAATGAVGLGAGALAPAASRPALRHLQSSPAHRAACP